MKVMNIDDAIAEISDPLIQEWTAKARAIMKTCQNRDEFLKVVAAQARRAMNQDDAEEFDKVMREHIKELDSYER